MVVDYTEFFLKTTLVVNIRLLPILSCFLINFLCILFFFTFILNIWSQTIHILLEVLGVIQTSMLRKVLEKRTPSNDQNDNWCYWSNFD